MNSIVEFCSVRCKAYVKQGFFTKKGAWKVTTVPKNGTIVSKRKKTTGEWEFVLQVPAAVETYGNINYIVKYEDVLWSEKPLLPID
jgi:hypothetical protein